MRQVIEIIETVHGGVDTGGAGLVECWWNQHSENGDDPEDCVAFASVESEIYAGLATWYEQRARGWVAAAAVSEYGLDEQAG